MVHRMLDVNVEKRATIDDVCNVAKKMRIITEEARRKRKELEAAKKAEEAAKKYVQKVESSRGSSSPSDGASSKVEMRGQFQTRANRLQTNTMGKRGFEDADPPGQGERRRGRVG